MTVNIDMERKLEKKLQERIYEEAKKDAAIERASEISDRQDELLRHNICPKCGEDANKVFSILGLFSLSHKKMKCSSCGFKKYVNMSGFGSNEYY